MPRRPARLTIKKQKKTYKKRKIVGGDPDAPTDDEWKTMAEFGSFIVRDEDGDEHTFKRGDTAAILPSGIDVGDTIETQQYWVGRIREVRLRTPEDVWTRVQWYWSGAEVHGVIKSFDAAACGRYERIFSDHFDYVSTSAFNAVVPLKKLIDTDIEQPHIPRDAFYTRYTFEYRARVIQPKPGSDTCLCNAPYAPDDPSPSALMHFCPRPACRRFFHAACLAREGRGDGDAGAASRGRRLLAAAPDVDGVRTLGELGGGGSGEPVRKKARVGSVRGRGRGGGKTRGRGRGRGRSSGEGTRRSSRGRKSLDDDAAAEADAESESDAESDELRLAALPPDLVLVAEQPIVRGAAFRAGGVSGNVGAVVRARRMVYEVLAGGELPEDWEEALGAGVQEAVVEVEGESEDEEEGEGKGKGRGKANGKRKGKRRVRAKEGVAAFLCPECGGAI